MFKLLGVNSRTFKAGPYLPQNFYLFPIVIILTKIASFSGAESSPLLYNFTLQYQFSDFFFIFIIFYDTSYISPHPSLQFLEKISANQFNIIGKFVKCYLTFSNDRKLYSHIVGEKKILIEGEEILKITILHLFFFLPRYVNRSFDCFLNFIR